MMKSMKKIGNIFPSLFEKVTQKRKYAGLLDFDKFNAEKVVHDVIEISEFEY